MSFPFLRPFCRAPLMKLGTTECLGVKEWELCLFQIANQAPMKPQLKKCGLWEKSSARLILQHRTEQQRHLGLRGKGPKEWQRGHWLNAMRVTSFPQSSPMGRKGLPNLHTRVTSGHLQLPVLRWAETNMENSTRFRCSFAVVKTISQILHWLPGVGTFHRSRESLITSSLSTGPKNMSNLPSSPALGSLASTTFMRVILLLSHILYSRF